MNNQFVGLTMPVFNAFGWISEENALKYALEQMELFVNGLHLATSREAQNLFPHRGLDRVVQGVYLGRSLELESDLYITYHAKPTALRMAIQITDRTALARAITAIQANHSIWMETLDSLQGDWELRLQQMEYNPETKEATHYKDLFKGPVTNLTPLESAEYFERMSYLNGEDKWISPLTLSKRTPSEFIAAMGTQVTKELAKEMDDLLPILHLFAGGVQAKGGSKKSVTTKTTKSRLKDKITSASDIVEKRVEDFSYNTQLKPLHIKRGFINMTPTHWPFFALNSRTETREVILRFDGHVDKKSAVWRMVPNDVARLVLSDKAHVWLEDNFSAEDEIQIHATKRDHDIEIELSLVHSD